MPELRTVEQRQRALRGVTSTVLREYPGWQAHDPEGFHSVSSSAMAESPVTPMGNLQSKPWSPIEDGNGRASAVGEKRVEDIQEDSPPR